MPSKKQRARAAKAAKAAAKAAEPQPQPALDAPRTLRAQLRADERAIRRQTATSGALKAVCVKRKQIVPGCRYSVAASATASSSRVAVHVQHK